jgi:hypothetical protein
MEGIMPENSSSITIKKVVAVGLETTQAWDVVGTATGCNSVSVNFFGETSNPEHNWETIPPVTAHCDSEVDTSNASMTGVALDETKGERVWVARFLIHEYGPASNLPYVTQTLLAGGRVSIQAVANTVAVKSEPLAKDETSNPIVFEVGVLFVHGIGQYARSESLTSFGDPLIEFMRKWYGGFNDISARAFAGDVSKVKELFDNPRFNDDRKKTADKFAETAKSRGAGDFARGGDQPVIGSAEITDMFLWSPTKPEIPASVVVRLSEIDEKEGPRKREANIVISEAWWTTYARPPTRQQLLDWAFKVSPLMVGASMKLPIDRARCHLNESKTYFGKLAGFLECLFAVLFVVPAYLLLCLATQLALIVVAKISELPIPRLRAWLEPVLLWLIGVPGQSYVLINSHVQRASILTEVEKRLEWMRERCRKVIVVAHSQGAAVAYLVLSKRKSWENVEHFITVGSGVKKLRMLEMDRESHFSHLWSPILLTWVTMVTLGVIFWISDIEPLIKYLSVIIAIEPTQLKWWIAVSGYLIIVASSLILHLLSFSWSLDVIHREKPIWTDYYASHDPVPSGEPEHLKWLIGKYGRKHRYFPVNNHASIFRDHNSYWENTEEVVAPIAMTIANEAGLLFGELTQRDANVVEHAKALRGQCVRALAHLKVLLIVVGSALLGALWSANHAGWRDQLFQTNQSDGLWGAFLFYGAMILSMLWELFPVVFIAAIYLVERSVTHRRMQRGVTALMEREIRHNRRLEFVEYYFLLVPFLGVLVAWGLSDNRGIALFSPLGQLVATISAYLSSITY